MLPAKIKVMPLAIVTGRSLTHIPYISQSVTPKTNRRYMESEMLLVFLVLMIFNACGTKETVVQNAAANPITVLRFFINSFYRNLI